MRKILSGILCLCMVWGCLTGLPANVSAAEADSKQEVMEKADLFIRFWAMSLIDTAANPDFPPDDFFLEWTPERFTFNGTITKQNWKTVFFYAWNSYNMRDGLDEDGYFRGEPYREPTGVYGYHTHRVPEKRMLSIMQDYVVCRELRTDLLPYYDKSTGTFVFSCLDGWGGPPLDFRVEGDTLIPDWSYWSVTKNSSGNWVAKHNRPTPNAEYPLLQKFTIEMTPDYKVVSVNPGIVELESIKWLVKPPVEYAVGEPLNLDKATIVVEHIGGSSRIVPVTANMITGYRADTPGKQNLTLQYIGQSLELQVTVHPKSTTTTSTTATAPTITTAAATTATTTGTTTAITSAATASTAGGPPLIVTDDETGIQLETPPGVVPEDTVLDVKPVTEGGNFIIINNALEQTSNKWVAYDISLLSNTVAIQPNGKVKITMPRPLGLNKNKMVLYHIADDGTLTQIPFTLDSTENNIVFETDHFSLYAVAEADSITNTQESRSLLLWILLPIGIVALAGAGTAVWFLKFRKKRPDAGRP